MKKIVIVFLVVCLSFQAMGQYSDKVNAIKLNFSSLLAGHIGLQYERVVAPKMTVCFQARYRPSLRNGQLNNLIEDPSGSSSVVFSNIKFSSIALTPEFRYYFKEAMRGFYMGPYLRYRMIPYKLESNYYDLNNNKLVDKLSGTYNTFMLGGIIGTNIYLSETFNLDIFIVGAHYSLHNFNMDWKSSFPLSPADQEDIKASFDEFQSGNTGVNFDYTVNANGATINTKANGFGVRVLGLNLVYKF